MAYNTKMLSRTTEEQAKRIMFDFNDYIKFNDVFSIQGSLGGSAKLEYLSKSIFDILIAMRISKRKCKNIVNAYDSKDYRKLLDCIYSSIKNKIVEHMIPFIVCLNAIKAYPQKQSVEYIRHILDDGIFVRCIISAEENKRLNKAFKSSMPKSWNGNLDKDATFARYRAVGIEVMPIETAVNTLRARI